MSDRDIPESDTDWLANCAYGYGFGYTKSQALMEMMKHVHEEEDLTVTLAEHTGNVRVGPTGARFEGELVQDETLTIEADQIDELRETALDAIVFEHIADQ